MLRHHLAYLDRSARPGRGATTASAGRSRATCRCERWLAARPRAAREEMLDHLRGGRFEVCALPFTLARRGGVDRRARAAAPLRGRAARRTASRSSPRCRPTCRARRPACRSCSPAAGVRYLAVAHNWAVARRAVPDRRRGAAARIPLGGRGPASACSSGTPTARTASRTWRATCSGSPTRTATRSSCCRSTSPRSRSRGYPYAGPHETLGLPDGRGAARRIRSTSCICACRGCSPTTPAPSLVPAEIVRAWDERVRLPASSARRRTASSSRELEERHGAGLETFRGDWADWWADGLGSAAREVGFNRRAQAAVRTAQTLHVDGRRARRRRARLELAEADRGLRAHGALRRAHLVRGASRRATRSRAASRARCSGSRRRRSRSRRATAPTRCSSAAAARFRRAPRRRRSSCSTRAAFARTRRRRGVPAGEPCRRRARRRRRRARRARAAARWGRPSRAATGRRGGVLSFVARDVPGARLPPLRARRGRRADARCDGAGHARERALPRRARRRGRLRGEPARPRARARARRRGERVRVRRRSSTTATAGRCRRRARVRRARRSRYAEGRALGARWSRRARVAGATASSSSAPRTRSRSAP